MKCLTYCLLTGAVLLGVPSAFADDVSPPVEGIAPDPALIEKSAPPADTSYRTAARGGIIAGTILEAIGLAGMMAGELTFALSDAGPSAGMPVMIGAGGMFVLGGFISTAAHTSRHLAYKRAGIATRGNMAVFGWLFTAASTALWIAAIPQYVRHEEPDRSWDHYAGTAMGFAMAIGFSMVCEALNLSVFRTLWRRDMRLAEEKRDFAVALTPLVIPSKTGSSGSTAAGLAVVGSF